MSRASSPAASPDHRMDGDHGGRPYGRGSGSDFGSPSGDSSAARAAFGATGGAGHTTGGVSAYGGATPLRRGDATPYSRTGSSRGFGASRGPYAATHGSEHQPGSDHQAISMNLIRRCLSTVDSLYSNVQSFHPGAAAAAAARNARQVSAAAEHMWASHANTTAGVRNVAAGAGSTVRVFCGVVVPAHGLNCVVGAWRGVSGSR